ncbi:mechanosensitive ion channel domain-containing protein [Cellulomonas hominis]
MTEVEHVIWPVVAVVVGVVLAYLLATVIGTLVRSIGHRSAVAADLSRRSRRPMRAVLVVVAVWVALSISTDPSDWTGPVERVLTIALIGTLAWLVGSLAFVGEDAAMSRYRVDVPDNRHARRVRTQIQVLRRLTVAVLVVVAVGAALLTFPGARTFGTSLLASAGLLSIVAGLAAQSSLANVFAGLQLAFTDAIRVDDVVIADGEWGRIEEITLTYVVVHVWDDRRLILPSTYFTTTPFENWTRRAADLLGTVEIDLDWAVPVDAMRAELVRLLEATDLWDHRVGVLQVTEATGGYVRLRALASAVDAPTLFDLRCYVREGLVVWLQREAPGALPRVRLEQAGGAGAVPGVRAVPGSADDVARADAIGGPRSDDEEQLAEVQRLDGVEAAGRAVHRRSVAEASEPPRRRQDETQRIDTGPQDARLFTGSIDAIERSRAFSGPGQDVIEEREQTAHARGDGHEEPDPATGPGAPASTQRIEVVEGADLDGTRRDRRD